MPRVLYLYFMVEDRDIHKFILIGNWTRGLKQLVSRRNNWAIRSDMYWAIMSMYVKKMVYTTDNTKRIVYTLANDELMDEWMTVYLLFT